MAPKKVQPSYSPTVPDSPPPPQEVSVLFVCLGNICRSTMAEAVFRSQVSSRMSSGNSSRHTFNTSTLDSAGTGAYHVGAPPDSRTLDVLNANGIDDYDHSARKVKAADFEKFDFMFAMDDENLEDLLDMRENVRKRLGGGSTQAAGNAARPEDGLSRVLMFGAFGGKNSKRSAGEEVGDPYYGGKNGFSTAYEQMQRFSRGFLTWLDGGGE